MSNNDPIKILSGDLLELPVVKAWHAVHPHSPNPVRVEEIKREKVFRMVGVGPDRADVIAKKCSESRGRLEYSMYREVLPSLSLRSIACYGFLELEAKEKIWLFLEDAGNERFREDQEEHRVLCARWIGNLHASAQNACDKSAFPERGVRYYFELLRVARAQIVKNRNNPCLQTNDLALLDAIVRKCDLLESHEVTIRESCAWMPMTLVHSDLKTKNMHLMPDPTGISIVPLDWEYVGWGIPCADLINVDLSTYWQVVTRFWPDLSLEDIKEMARYGRLFRTIAGIYWQTQSLPYQWLEQTMMRFQCYSVALDGCFQWLPISHMAGRNAD